jgi:hypothetical protein
MLALLAVISLYGAGKYVRGLIFGFPDRLAAPAASPAPALVPASSPSAAPMPVRAMHAGQDERWKTFGARFGEALKTERGKDGQVVAIHGAPGSGGKARGGFRPDDSAQVLERAREVVDSAKDLLGIEPRLPLGEPTVRTGPLSAQVYFPETMNGLPLEPAGSVSVDLGRDGEILGVNSNYSRGVQVANERSLSADQAKSKAEAVVPEPGSSLGTLGGNPVIWVTNSGSGGAPVGRYAYDFNVAGRQVVVDAGNGEVLFRRDRRQF